MSNLGPQRQKSSYSGLLQIPGGVTSALQTVQDGLGNATALSLSTTSISALGIVSNTAQNIYGGSAGQIPVQTGVSTTSFISTGTTGQFLQSNGLATPTFVSVTASTVGALPTTGGAMTGAIAMGGNLINNLATPVTSTDAATKGYVDSVAVGLQTKTAVTCASTGNISSLSGLLTIDGITVTAGQRVLVKDQSTQANNGIYVAAAGAWSRSTDADTWSELVGAAVFVSSGTANAGSTWVTNIPSSGTIGVTAIVWNQFSATGSYTAGTGLALAGNQFSLITPVSIANGGTNSTATPTAGAVAYGTGSAIGYTSAGSSGQLLQSNGSSAPTFATVNVSTLGACAASVKPSSNGTFYSGSVSRLVTDMFGDYISVIDFGADATGVSDSTAAIQAALNACTQFTTGKRKLYFPAGLYQISAALTVAEGVTLFGDGPWATIISQNTNGSQILSLNANYNVVDGILFTYSASSPSAGSIAIKCNSPNTILNNFIISGCSCGVEVTAVGVTMDNFQIYNYVNFGIYFHDTSDCSISNFIINAQVGATVAGRGSLGGIRLYSSGGPCEAFRAVNGGILNGVYTLTADSSSNTIRQQPEFCTFTNVFFDSGTDASGHVSAYLNNSANLTFDNCYFYGLTTGANLAVVNGITFDSCTFYGCGQDGADVSNTASFVSFNGCIFENNQRSGAYFASASNFNVIGGCAFPRTAGQQYGIYIDSGCSNFVVNGFIASGNSSANIYDGTSSTTKKHIQNNIGTNVGSAPGYKYNDVTASRSAGTSYTNNTIEPILVEISANCPPGTTAEVGLQITESGSTRYLSSSIPSVGAGVYGVTTLVGYVPPGGSYKCVTYIGSPTFVTWYESSGTCS